MTEDQSDQAGAGSPPGTGALAGIRVVDLSRQAPGPYCSMLLADFGADVVLVEPPGGSTRGRETNSYWELERDPEVSGYAALRRNKRSISLDLKDPAEREIMDRLVDRADVLIEGFRPGVAERLGVDARRCRERNPGLVYCSITGYGQDGPLAQAAGHDLNYLALSGMLETMADPTGRPVPPLNLLADFAGGGLMAAYAIMVALLHRERTGVGQEIDLAMLDGAFSLLSHAASLHFARGADLQARRFFLSGQLPQYDSYRSADGSWYAVGALEPWFYERLLQLTGRPDLGNGHAEPELVDHVRRHLEAWFAARTAAEVDAVLGDADVCVTRVRSFAEGMALAERRGVLVRTPDGVSQIGVAARLSATPGSVRSRPPSIDEHRAEIVAELSTRLPGVARRRVR
ncbi:CaiB/BaiF CoA transferase family protein [Micromonospora sp. CB01531]|uniref:CaiB/BaiF CoA transferase family protein n=1 Tax=Micromonospora sp. CB01531 TaxID=1718947 RepID=UPI00093BE026|nr:CaiB/BaiF CoA-transferase family protein [Micromonospora sp. CB01531]OKI63380.1 hypothetical protein A6A27_26520 [Micromonospora sp. CB01531]